MTPEVARALTEHERTLAERVLAEEECHRHHLLVSLSGAHAYGFPSPDSDLDLKAIHVDPTATLLGFPRAPLAAERMEVLEGVEIDYSSNEIGPVLLGVLKGNGNFIERFLSGWLVSAEPRLEPVGALVQASLSRRIARHYQGFARQQLAAWEAGGRASAKKLLYVLRTTLTGAHALLTAEIVTDVTKLLERYGFGEGMALVAQKRRGEKAELPDALQKTWAERIPAAFEQLERAERDSPLPEEPPNRDALEGWLIDYRLRLLDRR